MTTTEDHIELVAELVRLLEARILDPLEILLAPGARPPATPDSPPDSPGSPGFPGSPAPLDTLAPLRARMRVEAEVWAAQLLGPDRELATHTGARLIAVLYPGDSDTAFEPPAAWWRTALGRAVARTAGHPAAAAVSYSTAGAMLGITRQGVHDLVKRGKLDRDPGGGVTSSSVRDRLNRP